MKSQIESIYAYLNAGEPLSDVEDVATFPLDVSVHDRPILLGIDAEKRRHVLIPIEGVGLSNSSGTSALNMSVTDFKTDGRASRYADLVCGDQQLDTVFENLVVDICERLAKSNQSSIAITRQTLQEWRDLLLRSTATLERPEAIGLVGELEILDRLATVDPIIAMDMWKDSVRALHDFRGRNLTIEVKARAEDSKPEVHIHGLNQLDRHLAPRLHLIFVGLREDDEATGLESRIAELIQRGVPRTPLITEVARRGYLYGREHGDPHRYAVCSTSAWMVDESFPRVTFDVLPSFVQACIGEVNYTLDQGSFPAALSPGALNNLLEEVAEADGS
ncbi:PD-(D/E)XK motif protein [Arthrobacter sp. AOP36-C1-22]|uniref:PD-(D/E)XK motif protein n=1 Tax=Arthrobacter sp. AOP36-C1-22 TaxID=3457683 RepID=UPI004034B6C7